MEEFDKAQVEKFVASCNDMLSGKFLNIKKALSNIVDSVAESDDILSFIAESVPDLEDIDIYESVFTIDPKTKVGKIALPSDEKEKLGITTKVFSELTSGKLNFTKFLETYFKNPNLSPTQSFLDKFVKPFRDIISKHFQIDEELTFKDIDKAEKVSFKEVNNKPDKVQEEEEIFEETLPGICDVKKEIERIVGEMQASLKFERKHQNEVEDVDMILNGLLKACESDDLLIINSLILGIKHATKKIKSVKHLVSELEDLIYDYCDYLAESQKEEVKEDYEEE